MFEVQYGKSQKEIGKDVEIKHAPRTELKSQKEIGKDNTEARRHHTLQNLKKRLESSSFSS